MQQLEKYFERAAAECTKRRKYVSTEHNWGKSHIPDLSLIGLVRAQRGYSMLQQELKFSRVLVFNCLVCWYTSRLQGPHISINMWTIYCEMLCNAVQSERVKEGGCGPETLLDSFSYHYLYIESRWVSLSSCRIWFLSMTSNSSFHPTYVIYNLYHSLTV